MQNVPKIVRERLKAATPAVNHPDADLLTAFAEHSLPDRERNGVLEHLARCGDCRDIVALALPEMEAVQTTFRPSPSGWLTWPSLRWGFVAAGVVAIASFSILQLQRHSQPTTVALKQSAGPEMAANEPKKAVAQFVAPASTEKNEKLQGPAAPAFADSADGANAIAVENRSATRPVRIQEGAVSSETKSGTNTVRGATVGGPIVHGPRVANQWQQTNAAQNQIPAATPQEFAKQQRAEADTLSNERIATTAETSLASGAAPAMAQPAPQSPSADEATYLTRAKPLASSTGGPVSNSPSRDQLKVASAPGQIAGYVVDPSGAVVSDARITIKAANAQVTATAMTNSQGAWLIAGLPSGNYKAQAEATGFRTTVLDLNYDANQPSMYSFTLSPGSVSETVEVAAQEAQAETSSASTIADRENSQPPLNGRDLKQMDTLSRRGLPRWAINAAGALQRSFDQGQTWQTVDVNANLLSANAASLLISANAPQAKSKDSDKALKQKVAPLTFRALADVGADVWAGGSAGSLYHSQDAGNHWIRVVPASASVALTGDILSLEFPDPQHGKISTSTSEIWNTADAGQTWQKQ
jgi:Carboxypeptidase regulatory-like domain/Putative zinc-finger